MSERTAWPYSLLREGKPGDVPSVAGVGTKLGELLNGSCR
ncbi:hypothetical protein B481_3386 [Planococcus halocryophilus Or1]|nr:hypothetical protein B481_3386 [Planococcus halocryophilus Or1]